MRKQSDPFKKCCENCKHSNPLRMKASAHNLPPDRMECDRFPPAPHDYRESMPRIVWAGYCCGEFSQRSLEPEIAKLEEGLRHRRESDIEFSDEFVRAIAKAEKGDFRELHAIGKNLEFTRSLLEQNNQD